MLPATSERNFTPSSTALSGPESTTPGTVVDGQIVYEVEGVEMTILKAFVAFCAGLPESVTCAVKL
jgi:hypothetical protein